MNQDSVNWGLLQDEYLERNFVIISYEKTHSHWVSSEYTRQIGADYSTSPFLFLQIYGKKDFEIDSYLQHGIFILLW